MAGTFEMSDPEPSCLVLSVFGMSTELEPMSLTRQTEWLSLSVKYLIPHLPFRGEGSCLCGLCCKHTVTSVRHLVRLCKSDSHLLHSYLSTWSTQFGDIPEALPAKLCITLTSTRVPQWQMRNAQSLSLKPTATRFTTYNTWNSHYGTVLGCRQWLKW